MSYEKVGSATRLRQNEVFFKHAVRAGKDEQGRKKGMLQRAMTVHLKDFVVPGFNARGVEGVLKTDQDYMDEIKGDTSEGGK